MTTIAIAKRELRSYFDSPIAYVFICLFLAISSYLFLIDFFVIGVADARPFFTYMPWTLLFFLPALTMRTWSEERKMGTLEILFTLPIRSWEAVIGKFVAAWALLLVTLALSVTVPLTVAWFAAEGIDAGPIVGSYLGAALLGAVYIAIGLFLSYLTENQVIAFVVTVTVCFLLVIAGNPRMVEWLAGATVAGEREGFGWFIAEVLAPALERVGLGNRFHSVARGVIDTRDLTLYGSLVGLFLAANVVMADHRRS